MCSIGEQLRDGSLIEKNRALVGPHHDHGAIEKIGRALVGNFCGKEVSRRIFELVDAAEKSGLLVLWRHTYIVEGKCGFGEWHCAYPGRGICGSCVDFYPPRNG